MPVLVKVLGVQEAIAKFAKVGVFTPLHVGYVLYRGAKLAESTAKGIVPVDTGHLRAGIQAAKHGPYTWGISASSMDGGADREYAGYVEYGTSKMGPEPYMRPAMEVARSFIFGELQKLAVEIERL